MSNDKSNPAWWNAKYSFLIIDRYAKISYHTCTNCGAPATKWTKSGWITSFCNKCYERYWEDE